MTAPPTHQPPRHRTRWAMPPELRHAYRQQRRLADQATATADAWRHLERAHIIAQPFPIAHTGSHWAMLRLAARTRNHHETTGQLIRLTLAGIASLTGRIPRGNTGRANMPLGATMPIPDDLTELLQPQPTTPTAP